ncbi:MAG: iron-sulfur cluster assembly accessory protein, partial [Pseudomonadota bacterium]
MFGIPGEDPVKLTDAAAKRIRALMDGGEVKGLRIGVKK